MLRSGLLSASIILAAAQAFAEDARPLAASTGAIDRLADMMPALAACWREPAGLRALERTEVTARFALRRDGSLLAAPRITFASDLPDAARTLLTGAGVAAIRNCTPVKITPGLGGAVAGRPFTIRFIYNGPQGRGA